MTLQQQFEELVATQRYKFCTVARKYTDSWEAAEDAVQDGFAAAYRNLSSFKGEAKLETWIHRIVVNSARMARRSLPARQRRVEPETERLLLLELTSSQDVEREVIEAHTARKMYETMGQLSPCLYISLTYWLMDLEYKEIAENMGISIGSVKAYVSRAKRIITKRLAN